jgi:LemA protein
MQINKLWIGLGAVVFLLVVFGGSCVHSYNKLNTLDQGVKSQWANVESAYQHRLDEISRMVEIVKGAANFEKSTYVEVTEARNQATKITLSADDLGNPDKFKKFEAAQANVSQALSKLMVVAENYPDLKATQNFRDLQVALSGLENRINVERNTFNGDARDFNTYRDSFPTTIAAGFFGSRFAEKSYFQADAGAAHAPEIHF